MHGVADWPDDGRKVSGTVGLMQPNKALAGRPGYHAVSMIRIEVIGPDGGK